MNSFRIPLLAACLVGAACLATAASAGSPTKAPEAGGVMASVGIACTEALAINVSESPKK